MYKRAQILCINIIRHISFSLNVCTWFLFFAVGGSTGWIDNGKSFHNIICLTQNDLLYTIFNIINDFVVDVLLLPSMYYKMIFNPFV